MKTAAAIFLVVALVVVLFLVLRSSAETPPAVEVQPFAPTLSAVQPTAPVPTYTVQRTAEEEWRARVVLAAQQYVRAMEAFTVRFPTVGGPILEVARSIAAAAPMEDRARLKFRLAFARKPPSGAYAANRAWDELAAAVAADINYRPSAPVVVQPAIIPLGDLSV